MLAACIRPRLFLQFLLFSGFLCIASQASAQAAAKQTELDPVTPWHVEWDEETCVMRRGFGSKDEILALQIERFGPGETFQMVLTGAQLRRAQNTQKLSIAYGDGGFVHKIEHPAYGTNKDGTPSIFVSTTAIAERDPREAESRVNKIILSWWRDKTLALKTGQLDRPFAELRKCTDDLLRVWKLDPEQQNTLTRPATPTSLPSKWIKSSDYPRSALLDGRQSLGNFRLIVGPDGVPTDCKIQRSYSGRQFDELTCQLLMKRARFLPALDVGGNPVPSYFFNTVNWIIGS